MATGQEALLIWCKENTKGYKGVNITDFDSSWKDGLALAALVDKFLPGKLVFATLSPKRPQKSLQLALDVAERNGISPLLDSSDILAENIDKAAMITYISQFYKKFGSTQNRQTKKASVIVGKDAMVCPECSKPLSGTTVQALSRNWHPECLNCAECKKSLSGGVKIMNIKDKPYCGVCGKKAFTSTFRIGGMGMGMPMMGMMGGPPPDLLRKKKEEARKAAEEEAANSGIPPGAMDHGTIRQRARGPTGRKRPTRNRGTAQTLTQRYTPVAVDSLYSSTVERPPSSSHARLSGIFNNSPISDGKNEEEAKKQEPNGNETKEAQNSADLTKKAQEIAQKEKEAKEKEDEEEAKRQREAAKKAEEEAKKAKEKLAKQEEASAKAEADKKKLEEEKKKHKQEQKAKKEKKEQEEQEKLAAAAEKKEKELAKRKQEEKEKIQAEEAKKIEEKRKAEEQQKQEEMKKDTEAIEHQEEQKAKKEKKEQEEQEAEKCAADAEKKEKEEKEKEAELLAKQKAEQDKKEAEELKKKQELQAKKELNAKEKEENAKKKQEAAKAKKKLKEEEKEQKKKEKEAAKANKSPNGTKKTKKGSKISNKKEKKQKKQKLSEEPEETLDLETPSKDINPKESKKQEEQEKEQQGKQKGKQQDFEVQTNSAYDKSLFDDVANKPLPPPPPADESSEEDEDNDIADESKQEMTMEEMQRLLDEQERLRNERKITNKSNWETSERAKIASYLKKKEELLAPVEKITDSGRKKISVPAESIKQWSEFKNSEKKSKAEQMEEAKRKRLEEEENAKVSEAEQIRRRLELLDDFKEEEVIEYNWEDVVNLRIEGFMDKQNTNAKSKLLSTAMQQWRTRWFLLQDNNLIYYREKQQNILGKNCPPDGVINLYSTTAIEVVDRENGVFKIRTPDQPYFLSAYDEASMDVWVKHLSNARTFYMGQKELLSSAPITSKADIQQSGSLEKLGRFNKWKSRWFVLRDGVLFRYNSKGGEQIGKFPLFKAELSEYRPEKLDGRCFQLKDSKQLQTLILRAKDVEEMHHWLNNILKQKVLIEETVNSIIIE